MVLRSTPRQPKDYKPEFNELGVDKVRSELLARRWDKDKLAAARLWVENQDAHNWVAKRSDAPPRQGPNNFRKYAMYIAIAFGVAYACVRLFRAFSRTGGF
jgi:hypothetical protein